MFQKIISVSVFALVQIVSRAQVTSMKLGVARAISFANMGITGTAVAQFPANSKLKCTMECSRLNWSSFNYGSGECHLHNTYVCEYIQSLVAMTGFNYYDVEVGDMIQFADTYRAHPDCLTLGRCSPKCYLPTTTPGPTTATSSTTAPPPTTTTASPTTTTTTPTSSTTTKPPPTTTTTTTTPPPTTTTATTRRQTTTSSTTITPPPTTTSSTTTTPPPTTTTTPTTTITITTLAPTTTAQATTTPSAPGPGDVNYAMGPPSQRLLSITYLALTLQLPMSVWQRASQTAWPTRVVSLSTMTLCQRSATWRL